MTVQDHIALHLAPHYQAIRGLEPMQSGPERLVRRIDHTCRFACFLTISARLSISIKKLGLLGHGFLLGMLHEHAETRMR